MTTIETKALCTLFRQAEEQGYRVLVEKMISLCDKQSGLKFEELWDWWNNHKEQDLGKQQALSKLLESIKHSPFSDHQIEFPPIYPSWVTPSKNHYEIIC